MRLLGRIRYFQIRSFQNEFKEYLMNWMICKNKTLFYSYFLTEHMLWILVRIASVIKHMFLEVLNTKLQTEINENISTGLGCPFR